MKFSSATKPTSEDEMNAISLQCDKSSPSLLHSLPKTVSASVSSPNWKWRAKIKMLIRAQMQITLEAIREEILILLRYCALTTPTPTLFWSFRLRQ
jgi:hypothetical protein